ncbi:MAG: esterase [Lachnospiraceae bacterium]|nr:esterase [Lachnospiraceae bacterium]
MTHFDYGNPDAPVVLLEPQGGHDPVSEQKEYELIREFSGREDFLLVTVPVDSWNRDLSPWNAPPVFGKEPFGDGAKETLRRIEEELIPAFSGDRIFLLGGYSLAGLFALWAAYESGRFSGVAACSPSVWFPGFMDFQENHEIRTDTVYLSLGDREEKAKNRVFAAVGDCIRESDRLMRKRGVNCLLEWNQGNHFVDGEIRTAKGFAWLLRQLSG